MSCSNHPTLPCPSRIRFGNFPARSSRATCAGQYKTFSRTCFFDKSRIAVLRCRKHRDAPWVDAHGRRHLSRVEQLLQVLLPAGHGGPHFGHAFLVVVRAPYAGVLSRYVVVVSLRCGGENSKLLPLGAARAPQIVETPSTPFKSGLAEFVENPRIVQVLRAFQLIGRSGHRFRRARAAYG